MSLKIVIIAAGGHGNRMRSDLPKQYHIWNGRPVLMHTIAAFKNSVDQIIVVIHPNMHRMWTTLCKEYNFKIDHHIVYGGDSRFQSVKNGLSFIKDKQIGETSNMTIAVHDAARPLIDKELIDHSFTMAESGLCNILAIRSINSVRIGNHEQSQSMDREQVWLVQTPQTFPAKILIEAFAQEEQAYFTDEASVVEKLGHPISIIEGNSRNIKITYPEDFEIAQLLTK